MKRTLSILGILFSIFAGAVNWSIVNTGLPSIQLSLHASLTELQWLMNAFGLCMVPFLVMMGRIADIYGRKLLFVIGAFLFCIPSLFGGLAYDIYQLVIWRGVQGFATAILLPISQVLITQEFPENKKGKAIGLWMLTIGIGCGLGPLIGGILITLLSWRWIFFFNIPFTLLGFLFCLICTKESKDTQSHKSLDIAGNIALIIALATLILAVVQGPDWGWDSPIIVGLFVICFVFCFIFYFIEIRTKNPIIEFHFYVNERFLSASLGVFYTIFFVWGAFFLLPLYLQNILLFEPYQAGLLLLLITVPFAGLSTVVGHLEDKVRPKYMILAGTALFCLSAVIGLFFTKQVSYTLLSISMIAFGVAWAILFGPCVAAGLSALPPNKTGVAAGSLNTLQEIGGSVGLAILGTILRNIDQNHVFGFIKEKGIEFSSKELTKIQSLMSNPTALMQYLSNKNVAGEAELSSVLYEGFLKGFYGAMYTLIGLSVFVFFFILFFMKKPTKKNTETYVESKICTRP